MQASLPVDPVNTQTEKMPVPNSQKTSFCKRLLQSIKNTVKKIFESLFFKGKLYIPTKQQVELIKRIKLNPHELTDSFDKFKQNNYDKTSPLDDTLQWGNHEVKNFVSKALEISKNELINDPSYLSLLKQTPEKMNSIVEVMKTIFKSLVPIGNKGSKPLFKKLKDFFNSKGLQDASNQIIKMFLEGVENKNEYKNSLKERIKQALKTELAPFNEEKYFTPHTADAYIDPILTCFFDETGNKRIDDLLPNDQFVAHKKDVIFEQTVIAMVNDYIDRSADKIKKSIENAPNWVFDKILSPNAIKITEKITERTALLIKNINWQNTFDEGLTVITDHIQHFNNADNCVKEEKKKIKLAKKALKQKPLTEDEIKKQNEFKQLLQQIEDHGGEKDYLQKVKEFELSKHCHSLLQKAKAAPENIDPKEFAKELLNQNLAKTVEEISSILVPQGFIGEIWDKVLMPEELQILLNESKQLLFQILPADLQDKLKNPLDEGDSFIKDLIIGGAKTFTKNLIHEKITDSVRKAVESFSTKEALEKTLATDYLPLVRKLVLEGFVKSQLMNDKGRFFDKFAVLFHRLTEFCQTTDEKKAVRKEIDALLYQVVNKKLKAFKLKNEGITPENFHVFSESSISEIEVFLRKNKELSDNKTTLSEVKSVLRLFYQDHLEAVEKPDNRWEDIIQTIAFRYGGMKAHGIQEKYSKRFIAPKLNTIIPKELKKFQKNHKFTTVLTTEFIKKKGGQRTSIKELLFSEKKEIDVQKKLEEEWDKFARLNFDLIVNQQSFFSRFILKQSRVLGRNSKKIEDICKKVSSIVFGNQELNQSLILRLKDIFEANLKASAEKIKTATQPITKNIDVINDNASAAAA